AERANLVVVHEEARCQQVDRVRIVRIAAQRFLRRRRGVSPAVLSETDAGELAPWSGVGGTVVLKPMQCGIRGSETVDADVFEPARELSAAAVDERRRNRHNRRRVGGFCGFSVWCGSAGKYDERPEIARAPEPLEFWSWDGSGRTGRGIVDRHR